MAPSKVCIGKRRVGKDEPAYIIAEIGSNHNQDLGQALEMISMAAATGVDAVKFQSIRFDQLYSARMENREFIDWFKQIELNETWYPELVQCAKKVGVDFLSSPTYEMAIDLLVSHDVLAFKLASPQVQGNLELVKKAAATQRPLILSFGYAEYGDIARAINVCRDAGNESLILLHCVSKYPVLPHESNLRFIQTLAAMTDLPTGYSDHTLGTHMAIAAVALGACVLEKHVTIDRQMKGPDHQFALTFPEFKSMVDQVREVEAGLGSGARLKLLPEELQWRDKVKKKVVAKCDIQMGEALSEKNVQFLRANRDGLSADEWRQFPRLKVKQSIRQGDLITWETLSLE